MSKIVRQLEIYINIRSTVFHGPKELMELFSIGQRMLQRDLKDLRECGLLYLRYDAKTDNYVEANASDFKEPPKPGARRRQHLDLLYRLCMLWEKLTPTDINELSHYQSLLWEYEAYKEFSKEDPIEFPPEEIGEPPDKPTFADIKAEYYELFPNGNERTRLRDFQLLTEAGYPVYYSRRYRAFIVGTDEF